MNQSWFPKEWSDKDIRRAGEHVIGLKHNKNAPDGKLISGVYKGVKVCVIKTRGIPGTIFPDTDQSSVLKKKKRGRKKNGSKKTKKHN